jgi:hypothetical protein
VRFSSSSGPSFDFEVIQSLSTRSERDFGYCSREHLHKSAAAREREMSR